MLSSLIFSFLLFFLSFSYMTGKFPPHKEDMSKAFHLMKEMITGVPQFNEANSALAQQQERGIPPTLEQMVEYQRLALKRTEVSLELVKIFKKFDLGTPSPQIALRLQRISSNMQEVEKDLGEVTDQIKSSTEGRK